VSMDGRREVLGIAVGDSESGAFWTEFLRDLRNRGLSGVRLAISDQHLGLRAAIDAVLVGSAWQRCRVHYAERRIMWRRQAESWPLAEVDGRVSA
jgi:putative transposase